jgi:hypothetical protein
MGNDDLILNQADSNTRGEPPRTYRTVPALVGGKSVWLRYTPWEPWLGDFETMWEGGGE